MSQGRDSSGQDSTGQNADRGYRVLIVDDNLPSAEMLSEILALEGHTVQMAHTGADALRIAPGFAPDVAVLDIGLPDQDGFELARRLKADPALTKVRLIAVSGYGQAQYPRRSKEAGFEHYLVKPVDLDKLLALIRALP